MSTLAERFADRFGGTPATAGRRLFWRCLYRRTLPFLPLLLLLRPAHFKADRELIRGAAAATSLREVNEQIDDYLMHPANTQWLRYRAGFRVSTRRLHRVAKQCLGAPAAGRN